MPGLRVAIVGTSFGQSRCAMLEDVPEAELVAVCGRDQARTEALAAEYGCEWTLDHRELLNRPDVDAVGIYTPTDVHLEVALACAAAGKHVITSKPTAVGPADGERMLAACREAGVKLIVEFDTRYVPGAYRVYREITEGGFGRLVHGDYVNKCHREQEYYEHGSGWRAVADMGGGCVLNQGVHAVDHMLWYQGVPEGVFALSGTFAHDIPAEDAASAVARFPDGSIATFTSATTFRNQLPHGRYGGGTLKRAEVHGVSGSATVEGGVVRMMTTAAGGRNGPALPADPPLNVFQDLARTLSDPHRRSPTLVADEAALDSVYVCAAIRESAASGRYVRLEELRPA